MSGSNGRVALLLSVAGVLVGGPVVLGILLQTWTAMEESRRSAREAPLRPAGPPPVPIELAAPPPAAPEIPLSELPVEDVVGNLLEFEAPGPHGDDFEPSLPYRVAWDARDGLVVSATVDLRRDGTIDEYWTLRPAVTRDVVDGGERVRMVVRDGVWVRE